MSAHDMTSDGGAGFAQFASQSGRDLYPAAEKCIRQCMLSLDCKIDFSEEQNFIFVSCKRHSSVAMSLEKSSRAPSKMLLHLITTKPLCNVPLRLADQVPRKP
jgi:hypothetical protein